MQMEKLRQQLDIEISRIRRDIEILEIYASRLASEIAGCYKTYDGTEFSGSTSSIVEFVYPSWSKKWIDVGTIGENSICAPFIDIGDYQRARESRRWMIYAELQNRLESVRPLKERIRKETQEILQLRDFIHMRRSDIVTARILLLDTLITTHKHLVPTKLLHYRNDFAALDSTVAHYFDTPEIKLLLDSLTTAISRYNNLEASRLRCYTTDYHHPNKSSNDIQRKPFKIHIMDKKSIVRLEAVILKGYYERRREVGKQLNEDLADTTSKIDKLRQLETNVMYKIANWCNLPEVRRLAAYEKRLELTASSTRLSSSSSV